MAKMLKGMEKKRSSLRDADLNSRLAGHTLKRDSIIITLPYLLRVLHSIEEYRIPNKKKGNKKGSLNIARK